MGSARFLLTAGVVAFAATLAVLALVNRAPEPRPVAAAFDAAAPGGTTDQRVARLEAAVRAAPRQADGHTALAAGYLQKARETADPLYHAKADTELRRALRLKPGDAGALTERGALRASRHDFSGALADARAARAAAPTVIKPYGILVDSLVELGHYRDAARALQEMVDAKPNLDAYTRVSYFRELHGDLDGAGEALRLAISAGGQVGENAAYSQALLGDLHLQRGRTAAARRAFRGALARVPGYPTAEHGLARADAAAGRLGPAMDRLRRLQRRAPSDHHLLTLAELELATGRTATARRHLRSVIATVRTEARRGVDVNAELARLVADHGDPRESVRLGRKGWAAAPSVRSADALGWALTRAGRAREGLTWARRALRLGSRDPSFLYHAGAAAARAGRPGLARTWLRRALDQAPRFSPIDAPAARRILAGL